MKTKLFSKNEIKEVVEALKNGEIIAFPTETVYGLGVISTSVELFNKLVEVKKRPPNKPFTLMCSSLDQVKDIIELNDVSTKLINKFMPGSITLILKTKKEVPHFLDLGTGFVGVRIPDDKFVLAMIKEVGVPLLVPSANISSFEPAKNDKEALGYFDNLIYGIVKGESTSNVPSTIIKVDGNDISLIREGPIKLNEIMEAIKNE